MQAFPAGPRHHVRNGLVLLILLALAALWMLRDRPPPSPTNLTDAQLTEMHPVAKPAEGHARSADCRECHRHNHDTWHASFHRTMTQPVTADTVAEGFDDQRIEFPRVREKFLLHRRDGLPWVTFDKSIDTYPIDKLKRDNFPLTLSTGSHHLRYFWAPMGRARTMAQLPVVYLIEAERWIPVSASFINPPDNNAHGAGSTWNESCVECHTTFPLKGSTGQFLEYDTTVAEFGIACEACHGPGAEHIRLHRAHPDGLAGQEDPIVNPASLAADLSAQVCAGCHSVFDQTPWAPHQPGKALAANRKLKTRERMLANLEERLPHANQSQIDEARLTMDSWFWPDGMARVTGREYNNLLDSACHTKGGMSCLNCHQLHQDKDDPRPVKEWANDQLHYERSDDQSCVKCHPPKQYADPRHTHHAAGSSGSRCYNCHMPHTTYGLFQAIRSHSITSPDAAVSRDTGRPTACNLCHLDKPLDWTAEQLHNWYGRDRPGLDDDDRTVSQVARLTLEGDAAQRALAAWTLSWQPALAVSGRDWIAPYLATLLKDPYPAVRYMAERSLRRLPGFEELDYDFLAPDTALEEATESATRRWNERRLTEPARPVPSVLIREDGTLDQERFTRHYSRRNDRRIVIAE